MPKGDGTGPTGQGRGMGRGLGPCGPDSQNPQDQEFQGGRRGVGRGKCGGGQGRGQSRGLGIKTENTKNS